MTHYLISRETRRNVLRAFPSTMKTRLASHRPVLLHDSQNIRSPWKVSRVRRTNFTNASKMFLSLSLTHFSNIDACFLRSKVSHDSSSSKTFNNKHRRCSNAYICIHTYIYKYIFSFFSNRGRGIDYSWNGRVNEISSFPCSNFAGRYGVTCARGLTRGF